MSKSNTAENKLLLLIYNAVAWATVADNAAATPLTNIYVALHTADPGEAGIQTTNEIAYTSYARVAVARTAGGWTVTNNSVSPVAAITFPTGTGGGSPVAMFFSTGSTLAAGGEIFHRGPIGNNLGPFTGATSDTITIPGLTGVAVDDRVAFFPAGGSTLPTGVTEGTVYWAKTVAGDALTISATQGGATIDITASGDGIAYKVNPIVCGNGITPSLTTGTTILED